MTRSSSLITIILLVSAAHATVHLLEQSIASAEQVISADYDLDLRQSGWLGFVFRLPYGLGAIFAGLLADRFGEKRILVCYLLGAALTCCGFSSAADVGTVYLLLIGLGTCASMYHPAGLALLANATTPTTRPRALGIHGIFGSLGIASAPFIAGLVLTLREGAWKQYYLLLGALSAGLGILMIWCLKPAQRTALAVKTAPSGTKSGLQNNPHRFQIIPYMLLVCSASIGGIVYGGVLHFLPRYLEESGALQGVSGSSSAGNFAAAIALTCGAAGQWTAGRVAVARILPVQLAVVFASNAPLLVWMAWADGMSRLIAAGIWAFVHFMTQPLYNALIAEFMSVGRRSFGFGFSNMLTFGMGAVGPGLVARFEAAPRGYTEGYLLMAVVAFLAGTLPMAVLSTRIAIRESDESS